MTLYPKVNAINPFNIISGSTELQIRPIKAMSSMSDIGDQLLMSTIREFLCLYGKGCLDYKIPTKKENALLLL